MDYGFSCSPCFILANEVSLLEKYLTFQEFCNGFHHSRDLFVAQFRIHRQRKHLLRRAFSVREIAGLVAQGSVERLKVQRIRIVDGASNFSLAEKFLKGVALFDANGVLVVDVFESLGNRRRHDAGNLREEAVVFGGVGLAGALPIRKMAQFDAENGGLDFVEAAVPTRLAAAIFFGLPVVA